MLGTREKSRTGYLFVVLATVITLAVVSVDIHRDCGEQPNETKPYDDVVVVVDRALASDGEEKVTTPDDEDERWLQYAFRPKLTAAQRNVLIATVQVVARAFDAFNVSYHMCGGTLLGSYLHHGLIPWDDDADLCLLESDRLLAHEALRRIPSGYAVVKPIGQKRWKVFSVSSNETVKVSVPREPIKWKAPFIDICFCDKNGTHFWELSNAVTKNYKLSTVFPLAKRPFDGLVLKAPGNTKEYLTKNYSLVTCNSGSYSHTRTTSIDTTLVVPCKRLWKYYPFVFRTKSGSKGSREVLKIGAVTLGFVKVDRFDSLI